MDCENAKVTGGDGSEDDCLSLEEVLYAMRVTILWVVFRVSH